VNLCYIILAARRRQDAPEALERILRTRVAEFLRPLELLGVFSVPGADRRRLCALSAEFRKVFAHTDVDMGGQLHIQMAPGGEHLLVVDGGSCAWVALEHAAMRTVRQARPSFPEVRSVDLAPDGQGFALGDNSGRLGFFETPSLKELGTMRLPGRPTWLDEVRYDPSSQRVAALTPVSERLTFTIYLVEVRSRTVVWRYHDVPRFGTHLPSFERTAWVSYQIEVDGPYPALAFLAPRGLVCLGASTGEVVWEMSPRPGQRTLTPRRCVLPSPSAPWRWDAGGWCC